MESNDAEVDDMLVGVSIGVVLGVQFLDHATDDGDIGGVGALGRVIRSLEAVVERR